MTTAPLASPARPLRVAVVGSGPSGFYAAQALLSSSEHHSTVDMFERLPTPFGLVRGGVAPDHQKIKAVVRVYNKIANDPRFRLYANVRVATDLPVSALYEAYDAVIFAVGAESSRSLGIPGEDLVGSYSATEFVGWYNGHPDFQDRAFDLSTTDVAVIGVGNVAMDVARIIAQEVDRLSSTDITASALATRDNSNVRRVTVIGRRGAAQAAFTPKEFMEIDNLDNVDLLVSPEDATLDPASQAWLEAHGSKNNRKNVALVQQRAAAPRHGSKVTLQLRFLRSPVAIIGTGGRVSALRVERNVLQPDGDRLRPVGSGEFEDIPCGLVFRAVGYKGVPLDGVPFDTKRARVLNREGRVVDLSGEVVPGAYVVGWAKRGPSGLIGTNRADSKATVACLLADLVRQHRPVHERTPEQAQAMVQRYAPHFLTLDDWRRLDAIELERGEAQGKIREKFTSVAAMLKALGR